MSINFSEVSIFISGCFVSADTETVYRRQITVESNLSKFQINDLNIDSTTVYPIFLEKDIKQTFLSNFIVIIFPIKDTGFIKFIIFGGKGNSDSPIPFSFKDSLTINTPIDTTRISINDFSFN